VKNVKLRRNITISNVVRELVGELNLRSVEAFLMFSNVV